MPKQDDLLAALGRFSEPALYILISLADGPKHGYAMTHDIEAVAGHKFGPGTLYGAIARLESRKWIEPLPAEDRRRPVSPDGRRAESSQASAREPARRGADRPRQAGGGLRR